MLELILIIDGQKHVAGKQTLPCFLGDDAHPQAIFGIGPGVAILNEKFFVLGKCLHSRYKCFELLNTERTIVLTPPDLVFGGFLSDNGFVCSRSCRVLSRVHQNGPLMDAMSFIAEYDFLVKRRGW